VDTLGVVESASIAAGVELADGMVKSAEVELVRASTICSGRYLIYVAGDREAVGTAVNLARESGHSLAGSFVISNIAEQVLDVLKKSFPPEEGMALGLVESRAVAPGIMAADCAVKRSMIRLLRLVAGQGINGKCYFVFTGDVAAVREASEAACAALENRRIGSVVIPRPDPSLMRALFTDFRRNQ
jgi:microcompartment protein CcmL/EutN